MSGIGLKFALGQSCVIELYCLLIRYGTSHCLIVWHLAYFDLQGAFPDLCTCIKSHDLYHARESPLNLCCLGHSCGVTLPEPEETVQFGVRSGIRNDYSSSN